MGKAVTKRFCLVLVKPSHYDDDGYVIQWLRSPIPSTSLAALYGLANQLMGRRSSQPLAERSSPFLRCCLHGAGRSVLAPFFGR